MTNNNETIYIVASRNRTLAGWLIRARARLKFWNRYAGDGYSHISLSLDPELSRMMSFARRRLHNPLAAGLVREDIRTGVFALHPEQSRIAVFALPVTAEQRVRLGALMEADWARRDALRYNFLGLFAMLVCARGAARPDHYFCSQWACELLDRCGIRLFGGKKPYHIRPFDFYCALRGCLVYEGATTGYPLYQGAAEQSKGASPYARTHGTSDLLPPAEGTPGT